MADRLTEGGEVRHARQFGKLDRRQSLQSADDSVEQSAQNQGLNLFDPSNNKRLALWLSFPLFSPVLFPFTGSLAADGKVRGQLKYLEEQLDEYAPAELTSD
jgi:hypothetical protein